MIGATATAAVRAPRLPTQVLLLGGIVGPVLFVGEVLVDGATRPGYDPVRYNVSLLSLGDGGWVQVATFMVSGALIAAFGLGLGRVWSPGQAGRWIARLVVAVGLALIWAGVFPTDPAQGYPPGVPMYVPDGLPIPSHPSWHALLHFLGSIVVFVGLATAGLLTARRGTRWRGPAARAWTICSVLTAAIVIVGWISAFAMDDGSGPPATAGLLQRISVIAAMQWLVVAATIELRAGTWRGPTSGAAASPAGPTMG